ncbi:MAG: CmpA/NrtA family ABC transporter substrate-binding protein [Corynebacterium variabile]|uniref:CmpA/NrtA family ABC transporter substrate-binding protein n=1 Tax=Corynebacterium variabile TaxID=1727 RepID=UPI003F9117DB
MRTPPGAPDHLRMGRRGFLALAGITAGSGLLAACGTASTAPPAVPAAEPGTHGADVSALPGIENPELTIGFIPITCASPLVNAAPLGIYAKHGLRVTLKKYAGWADLWGAYVAGEVQATHMLAPMPLALHHGFASGRKATRMPLITNVNGQAITLANRHRDTVRGPEDMRGFVLGIPFDFSMHNLLLRHYLSTGGLDPDLDVDLRILRPADMVANLLTGNIDGFLGPDPFNQLAVARGAGYLFTLTRDLWDGHPCCCLGVSDEWAFENPVTYRALTRAVADAAMWSDDPAHRPQAAASMATEQFLNQQPALLTAILTGTYPDGAGRTMQEPDRIGFRPFPREDFGMWILTQLQRWGLTDGRDLGGSSALYAATTEVFDTPAAARAFHDLGISIPSARTETITGIPFNPARTDIWTRREVTL